MALPMLALATVASAISQKKQEADARKQQQIDIMRQQAGALGAPTYGIQAAQFNKELADKPTMTDQLLGGYAKKKIGGFAGDMGATDDEQKDLLAGL